MIHSFLAQAEGKGSVITVSSGAANSQFPNMSSYISSKLAQASSWSLFILVRMPVL
jgi:short-subunit dehydrogenase